jgi:hypothetical protein
MKFIKHPVTLVFIGAAILYASVAIVKKNWNIWA